MATMSELGKSYSITQSERDSMLMNLIRGADYSKWGMVNAITETANEHPSYDRAVELQRMGEQGLK